MNMIGYKRQVVAQHERVLVLRNGVLDQVLGPGVYRWLDIVGSLEFETFDLTDPELAHPHAEVFRKESSTLWNLWVETVETGEHEAGLIYLDGQLTRLIPPMSRRFYWKGPVEVRVERIDLTEGAAVGAEVMERIRRMRHRDGWTRAAAEYRAKARSAGSKLPGAEFLDNIIEEEIADHETGLLLLDGRLVGTLEPGVHAFWNFDRNVQVELTDLRLQELEVQGQEILTRDKVSLRINLSAQYRVMDPVQVRAGLPKHKDFLYRELQFGLRRAISDRTLDELLERKGTTEQEVLVAIRERAEPHGIAIESLGIKDVILPGDMKQILNQVVEAEKAAQANLIRRREETAATRSLLNTAKLMDQNPVLLRLKELEALERVTERVGNLTVFGGMESLLQGLVRIEAPKGG
ncbi:band 7 protein [Thiorhodococcus drewsii AZ1]|uniref:Band 7 protein n=1 Tax=Thiorhodococcus drewsii AZ1 TaxID=765913 RepID=G2E661_9GAMM|nr:slipin family protein [Thiorhodococcus drewsii]EGV28409.1 band 7 protein [Thiorhodococcus drewsii AZ1]